MRKIKQNEKGVYTTCMQNSFGETRKLPHFMLTREGPLRVDRIFRSLYETSIQCFTNNKLKAMGRIFKLLLAL